jgi:hypothetical protein
MALPDIQHTVRAHWRLGIAAIVVVLALVAGVFTLSAWNSSSESGAGVAESQTTTSTTDNEAEGSSDPEQAMLEFAECVRENGVPTFRDPVANADGTFDFQRPEGVDQSTLINAVDACRSKLEGSGAQLGQGNQAQDPEVQDALLEFAQCMRENGVPEFPDPKLEEGGGMRSLFGDINPQAPRVQEAMEACQSILSQVGGPFGGGGA